MDSLQDSTNLSVGHNNVTDRHEPAEGTQQHKMKVCAGEAHEKGLKGDERRAFMSNCLRKHPAE